MSQERGVCVRVSGAKVVRKTKGGGDCLHSCPMCAPNRANSTVVYSASVVEATIWKV